MINTARLIITKACPRRCSYCCNKYDHILSGARHITYLSQLQDFPEVCITGGEPGVFVERTLSIAKRLREQGHTKIYVYSAWYRKPWLDQLAPYIDGVHFTVHENPTIEDIDALLMLQMDMSKYKEKSYRLYIHQSVDRLVTIIPSLWKRIESKPWVGPEDCELPANEELFIYEGE
jgi:organic radical activating enzyme